MQHTDCGMLTFTNEQLHQKLHDERGTDASDIDFLPFPDLEQNVREDVRRIQETPHLDPDITVSGYIYDVGTGAVTEVVAAQRVGDQQVVGSYGSPRRRQRLDQRPRLRRRIRGDADRRPRRGGLHAPRQIQRSAAGIHEPAAELRVLVEVGARRTAASRRRSAPAPPAAPRAWRLPGRSARRRPSRRPRWSARCRPPAPRRRCGHGGCGPSMPAPRTRRSRSTPPIRFRRSAQTPMPATTSPPSPATSTRSLTADSASHTEPVTAATVCHVPGQRQTGKRHPEPGRCAQRRKRLERHPSATRRQPNGRLLSSLEPGAQRALGRTVCRRPPGRITGDLREAGSRRPPAPGAGSGARRTSAVNESSAGPEPVAGRAQPPTRCQAAAARAARVSGMLPLGRRQPRAAAASGPPPGRAQLGVDHVRRTPAAWAARSTADGQRSGALDEPPEAVPAAAGQRLPPHLGAGVRSHQYLAVTGVDADVVGRARPRAHEHQVGWQQGRLGDVLRQRPQDGRRRPAGQREPRRPRRRSRPAPSSQSRPPPGSRRPTRTAIRPAQPRPRPPLHVPSARAGRPA